MHQSSLDEMAKFALTLPHEILSVLDIGAAGSQGYREIFQSLGHSYTGCDLVKDGNVDIVVSGEYDWPELDYKEFDVVISGQVIEHVRMPWRWIRATYCVMKHGGVCCHIAPHTFLFHEHPHDCWRVWPEGMIALFEWALIDPINVYKLPEYDTVGIGRKPQVFVLAP